MPAITPLTGGFPTDTPANLSGSVSADGYASVDVRIIMTSGEKTYYLIGYADGKWWPIGTAVTATASTDPGDREVGRYEPGHGYTHFHVWDDGTGAGTLATAYLQLMRR